MVRVVCVFCLLLVLLIPSITAFAAEESEIPEEYEEMLDSLPGDIADMLPEEIFSDNIDDILKGVEQITSWEYIFDTAFDILGLNIKSIIKSIATICALLALCALLSMLKNSIKNLATEQTVNLVSAVTVSAAVLQISREPIEKALEK